ncbi:MAG: LrgB family protein [Spirochaetales bacterium]|nr:LrgB family protein [Spirochaetales bacterium]
MNAITSNLLFGIILSLIGFEIGLFIFRKTKFPLFNPLLLGILFVIGVLKLFNIDFEDYDRGASFINLFLGPATVVLAVPLYKQLELLKSNWAAISVGIFVGSLVSVVSVILLCMLFGVEEVLTVSLIPKSVTTPIGIELSKSLGGDDSVTVMAIIISGITGAIFAPLLCKIFRIINEVAVGVAIGTASHAVGTSKALELGQTQGAMSSLSIGLAGIITVIIAPLIFKILM